MSSGQKACYDDEEEWDRFKDTRGLSNVNWRVYSSEADAAKELVRRHPSLSGPLLKLDVMHEVQRRALNLVQIREREELVKALALLEKLA